MKALLILYLACLEAAIIREDDPIVVTDKGDIMGKIDMTMTGRKYYSFQGIPYAKPPLGELRFSAPEDMDSWYGSILVTQEEKSKCIQISGGSEDCLYLNIFSTNLNASAKLPVMVWIYGGGFFEGSSSFNSYNPEHLLDHDVLVVTLNYRVGIYGFFTTGDSVVPGNSGFKDQIKALEWIQTNIENFGGDASKVTVFGQSAGSVAVSYLLQSNLTKNLFHRAVMQSGTSLNLWALARDKTDTVRKLAEVLGINSTDSKVITEELRKIHPQILTDLAFGNEVVITGFANPLDGLEFGPALEPDLPGAVLTGKSFEKIQNGDYNKIDILMGAVSEEALMFYDYIDLINIYFLRYLLDPSSMVPIDMNIQDPDIKETVGGSIKDHYFVTQNQITHNETIKFLSQSQFFRPIFKAAKLYSNHNKVFVYRFSYEGSGNGQYGGLPGVSHSGEIRYLLGNYEMYNEDLLTRKRMLSLWTNFAKFGDPTPEQTELLQNVKWEVMTEDSGNYLDIGQDLIVGKDPEKEAVDFWENLYDKYGNPPYDTY